MARTNPTTALLQQTADGDQQAAGQLMRLIYDQLHEQADRCLRKRGTVDSLQATELVHEAWVRLTEGAPRDWEGSRHFIQLAAVAMRSILIDRARARCAGKRGGGNVRVELVSDIAVCLHAPEAVLDTHEALERLAALDEKLAQVAELRCFLGLTHEEIARVLDESSRSVERKWRAARAWLERELTNEARDA
ncbi:MAG: ECF-type sigma factor [Planctomycetota bacterium]